VDFDIITNLVLLYIAEQRNPGNAVLRWASRNCFRAEERALILARLGQSRSIDRCAKDIAREVAALQAKDRNYWSRIIDELREMRREGKLLPEGMPVSRLCGLPQS